MNTTIERKSATWHLRMVLNPVFMKMPVDSLCYNINGTKDECQQDQVMIKIRMRMRLLPE